MRPFRAEITILFWNPYLIRRWSSRRRCTDGRPMDKRAGWGRLFRFIDGRLERVGEVSAMLLGMMQSSDTVSVRVPVAASRCR